jgi:site-specific DNA-methyltransferase (adenine-specific)
MARKPGPLRPLAIDECRIGPPPPSVPQPAFNSPTGRTYGMKTGEGRNGEMSEASGRWPANLILTDDLFSGDTPGVVGGGWQSGGGNPAWRSEEASAKTYGGFETGDPAGYFTGKRPVDTEGSYSRFFLIAKASRSEREKGLSAENGERANHHPTVKPLDLMRHLVRLVTPAGGVVLDPFLGSGTTAIAAELEGFEWIGIEREAEYVAIAEQRIAGWRPKGPVQTGMFS